MTNDSHQTLERIARRVPVPASAYDRLLRRRGHKERNRRLSAGALAIILAIMSFVALARAFRGAERPADEPKPRPPGIFSEVGGWIAFGDKNGIWAVDPSQPDDRGSQIKLSTDKGTPVAWSNDGSKLLILRPERDRYSVRRRLFVLNADGTETHLTTSKSYGLGGGSFPPDIGGSFSSDGSQVVYASKSSIYVVDTQGGTPRLLQTASRRWFSVNGFRVRALAYNPTYSPDGTQIAYFDGAADSREGVVHQLRVMNVDGSDTRILLDDQEADRIYNLAWSPDGERLAFGLGSSGIYTVGADGSGLTLVIPDGTYPYWSPDGSHISYKPRDEGSGPLPNPLEIAGADGTHVVAFGYGGSGPWNPLVQPEPEIAEVPGARKGPTLTSTLPLLVALLALVAGVVLIRRRMGRKGRNAIAPNRPSAS
jgi:hypothetical protein